MLNRSIWKIKYVKKNNREKCSKGKGFLSFLLYRFLYFFCVVIVYIKKKRPARHKMWRNKNISRQEKRIALYNKKYYTISSRKRDIFFFYSFSHLYKGCKNEYNIRRAKKSNRSSIFFPLALRHLSKHFSSLSPLDAACTPIQCTTT